MGLLAALVDQVRQNSVVDVELEVPDQRVALPAHARAELLQIAREALSNIARHAHATTARVKVQREADHLRLEIADDGVGLDILAPIASGHLGIANMRDRAGALGGKLEFGSPGRGTTISGTGPRADGGVGRAADEEGSTRDIT